MIEHLSYSSISSYLGCGANWKYHYIDQVPTLTSPELVFGSAFHGTVESFVGNNHQGDLATLWQEKWGKQLECDQKVDWGTDTPEFFRDEGKRILSHKDIQAGIFSIKAAKSDQGAKIEQKVELHVPGVPLPVIGYIDIITEDGIPGDFKTSGKSWSADKALNEMQPLFYLAALNQAGIQTPGWHFRHFIFVKTKTPQFQMIEHTHNPGQLMWLFKMIQGVWKGIESEVFPTNPTGWKCSPSYCEYWSICRGRWG